MEGIDPPRGFAFAWFKIGNANIGVYSVHLKSNLVTHGDPGTVWFHDKSNITKRGLAMSRKTTIASGEFYATTRA
jgi:hypothetical protein